MRMCSIKKFHFHFYVPVRLASKHDLVKQMLSANDHYGRVPLQVAASSRADVTAGWLFTQMREGTNIKGSQVGSHFLMRECTREKRV